MKKIDEKSKTVKLRRIVKTLTDFLKKNKLCYRLVISSPENNVAFEWHEMTNAKWLAEIVTEIFNIHKEINVPVDEILKLIELLIKKAEKEGDENV